MIRIFVCISSVNEAEKSRDGLVLSMPHLRRERYESARSEDVKCQLLAAQAALDGALAAFLPGFAPPAEFFYLPDGRPAVDGACISITHTSDMAVCAVSSADVGIDIERADRVIRPEMARRVLMPGEKNPRGLLGAWVDKEAYLKFTGEGISGGMHRYRAGENEIFDADGKIRAHIRRIETENHLISVCCGEKFEIEIV